MEVKFALNNDIREIHKQLNRYYNYIKQNAQSISIEAEIIFKQKLDLGLILQSEERVEALKTLTLSKDINDFQFIIILVDYNPNSSLFDISNLRSLRFCNQIKIFHTGFAMWKQKLLNV